MTIWTNIPDPLAIPPQYFTDWTDRRSDTLRYSAADGSYSSIESGAVYDDAYTPEPGSFGAMFGGDFYDRIHITPTAIDFGNLVGTQQYTLTVWSSHYFDRRLEALNLNNGEGIGVTGGQTPPFNFSPLEQIQWTVTGTPIGPSVIDAELVFDFDLGDLFSVPMTGRRVIAFAWRPDWSAGITERLEWVTDVMESYDGSEQRRSIRLNPRQSLEFSMTASGKEKRFFDSVMFGWGAGVFVVPLWYDGGSLAADLTAGAMTIAVDTDTRGYKVDGFAMLLGDDARTNEIVEIASLTSSQITLKRPTLATWPGGTAIFPALPARLQNQASPSRFSGDVSSTRLLFNIETPQQWATAHGLPTYRGYPVLTVPINWVTDPQYGFDRRIFLADNVSGIRMYDDETGIALPRKTASYTLPDRATVETWRRFVHAMKGRWGAAWVHTASRDIVLVAPLLSNALVFDCEWLGLSLFIAGGRKDIRIKLGDGTILYRRIVYYETVDADTERITIDTAPGIDIQPADVASISFMFLSRLDADAVELAWWTGSVAESVVTHKGFRNDV
mgnify:CR=1 FL=1